MPRVRIIDYSTIEEKPNLKDNIVERNGLFYLGKKQVATSWTSLCTWLLTNPEGLASKERYVYATNGELSEVVLDCKTFKTKDGKTKIIGTAHKARRFNIE